MPDDEPSLWLETLAIVLVVTVLTVAAVATLLNR